MDLLLGDSFYIHSHLHYDCAIHRLCEFQIGVMEVKEPKILYSVYLGNKRITFRLRTDKFSNGTIMNIYVLFVTSTHIDSIIIPFKKIYIHSTWVIIISPAIIRYSIRTVFVVSVDKKNSGYVSKDITVWRKFGGRS